MPVNADWCQCVIFVLNLMGIEQIPGDYWTAASLAEPDKNGISWMEYQGFTSRPTGEIPLPGDLLVLAGGAEVVTPQTWNGIEHLVPVTVDVWAGHIGIVENAQNVQKEGESYFQITLLSANWGVNARPAGVVGSCYNVDESIFLVPRGYEKARFFNATDLIKMRERIVNRAKRWALLGIAPDSRSTLDGYPLSPSGFVGAALMEPGLNPLNPDLTMIHANLVEIFASAAQPGDILIMEGNGDKSGYGIISSLEPSNQSNHMKNIQVIAMRPDSRVTGPETWNLVRSNENWIRVSSESISTSVRYYRFNRLPGFPVLNNYGIAWVNDTPLHVSISVPLTNTGGKDIEITNLKILIHGKEYERNGQQDLIEFPEEKNQITPGGTTVYSYSTYFHSMGEYVLDIQYQWQGKQVIIKNAASIKVN